MNSGVSTLTLFCAYLTKRQTPSVGNSKHFLPIRPSIFLKISQKFRYWLFSPNKGTLKKISITSIRVHKEFEIGDIF